MKNLLNAIEKFNDHKQVYNFKIVDGHLEFSKVYEKPYWTPRGFDTKNCSEIIERISIKAFDLPFLAGYEPPNADLITNIVLNKRGSGITSVTETKTKTLDGVDDLKELILSYCISESKGKDREHFGNLIKQGVI